MAHFDYATCHNLGPFKMNVHNGWLRLMFELNKKSSKIIHNATRWILVSLSGTIINHLNLVAIFFQYSESLFENYINLKYMEKRVGYLIIAKIIVKTRYNYKCYMDGKRMNMHTVTI